MRVGGYYRIIYYLGKPFIELGPFRSRKGAERYRGLGLDPVLAYMRPGDPIVFKPGWLRRKER